MRIKCVLLIIATLLFFSCNESKKQLSFYVDNEIEEDSINSPDFDNTTVTYQSDEEVLVPFEVQNGVKLIDVTVNAQFTVKMILDSGCSGTLISIAEAKYLYEKGCFTQEDILGITQSQIADGSIVENMVINLRELVIGNKISCSNVIATVSDNTQAPLLLGNEVLDRVPAYSVDNEHKVIKFKLR